MRLVWDASWTVGNWEIGLSVAPLLLSLGFAFDSEPASLSLALPFVHLWFEHIGSDPTASPWTWAWMLFRLTIWTTEFRIECALNDWRVGIECAEFDDCSMHFGPITVQIETDKSYNRDMSSAVPTKRLVFPRGTPIWPATARCRCCAPLDRRQCDMVTDYADESAPMPHRRTWTWPKAATTSESDEDAFR